MPFWLIIFVLFKNQYGYDPESHHQPLKENSPDISLMAMNINTKGLGEGKRCHDAERQFPTVLNVTVILRAARAACHSPLTLLTVFYPGKLTSEISELLPTPDRYLNKALLLLVV